MSDNWAGASPRVTQALADTSAGSAAAYGLDDLSQALSARFNALFEREVGWFFATTGTAANGLALAGLCPPNGLIFAHADAHIVCEEAGACEHLTSGGQMAPLPGAGGKITPATLSASIERAVIANRGFSRHAVLSLTQTTESGTLYTREQITALSDIAAAAGMARHMDGARFANAVAALNCAPADITWRAGIDALSFGLTKNGAMLAEAVIFFDPARAEELLWRRKRTGHIVSKTRFLAAQFLAMLDQGHWLDLAAHANAMAAQLAKGIVEAGGRLAFSCEANEVFPILPRPVIDRLTAAGGRFYEWPASIHTGDPQPAANEAMLRLVTSFATTTADVDSFVATLRQG